MLDILHIVSGIYDILTLVIMWFWQNVDTYAGTIRLML